MCLLGNGLINHSIRKQLANQSPYYLSFASVGAISLESRLDCWAKLDTDSRMVDLRQDMIMILSCLELPFKTSDLQVIKHGRNTELQYSITHNENNYYISLKSNPVLKETHYMITVKSSIHDLQVQRIQDSLDKHSGLSWQYYILHSGRLKERIDGNSYQELLSVVLKKFKAHNVKKYREGEMMVVTAYSPLASDNVLELEGSKCNLQAAVRHDKVDRQTYIYIGSPLIIADY